MQQVFRGHLVERSASYRERIDAAAPQAAATASARPAGVLHQFVGDCVAELGQLEECDPRGRPAAPPSADRRRRAASMCWRSGAPFRSPATSPTRSASSSCKTHLLDGVGGMLAREPARASRSDDVLLVASFRSYSPEVVDAAQRLQRARRAGDRDHRQPAVAAAEPRPACASSWPTDSSKPFRSLVAPLCLAQALVVSTGHRLAEEAGPAAARKRKARRIEPRRPLRR